MLKSTFITATLALGLMLPISTHAQQSDSDTATPQRTDTSRAFLYDEKQFYRTTRFPDRMPNNREGRPDFGSTRLLVFNKNGTEICADYTNTKTIKKSPEEEDRKQSEIVVWSGNESEVVYYGPHTGYKGTCSTPITTTDLEL